MGIFRAELLSLYQHKSSNQLQPHVGQHSVQGGTLAAAVRLVEGTSEVKSEFKLICRDFAVLAQDDGGLVAGEGAVLGGAGFIGLAEVRQVPHEDALELRAVSPTVFLLTLRINLALVQ